jgi:hypothetical protein
MMARPLIYAVGALFVLWLASVTVTLCYLAQIVGVPFLVGACVAWIGVFPIVSAILLVTNTHSADTDRLWGRRQEDKGIIETISEAMEREAAKRPGTAKTPDWAIGLDEKR